MSIINIEHVSKIYGDKTIFEDVSFGIQEGDKIGIVGINGMGKTTLLRLVTGEENPDAGKIIRQNGVRIAALSQNPEYLPDQSVEEFAMAGAPDAGWKVQSILNQLGISDYSVKMGELSGGQRRRAALSKALAGEFDLLLLDEPTNHLDEEMIRWLEDYLRNFRGTLLMVTHDRYFLDKVTNRILEINHGKLYGYDADYSGFLKLKAEREEMELAAERKRQSVLRIELEWAKRGCRARSTKQQARLMRLEALKNGQAPVSDQTVELDAVTARMGKKTIELHKVTKKYGGHMLVKEFDYIFLKNQRIGIVGPNGCGKSTLLKMIAGEAVPDGGSIEIGETVKIGYFAQEEQEMDDKKRVIDYVKDIAEYIKTSEGRIGASAMLERFLFTPDMQYAPIGKLSGGEKRRLYLLGVLCKEVNVLILDEPGNNLDIPTLTILEDFLSSFAGIIITVSHDRYFLDNVADRIFAFEGDGKLTQYEGGYTDYLEAREQKSLAEESSENAPGKKASEAQDKAQEKEASGRAWKQNRPQKLKFSYKEQKEFETIDEVIAGLEEKVEEINGEILKNATNSAKLSELMKEKEQTEKELEEKMERWIYLNELNEEIKGNSSA